jgi:manganese/iron transport system permease protein
MLDSFFIMILIAGAVAGAGAGLLGVYIVGMRLPFIGICVSHAAMAGVVFATLLGLNSTAGAVVGSLAAAALLIPLSDQRLRLDANVSLGIIFSIALGLTFLGYSLIEGARTGINAMLWGSLLFVTQKTVITLTIITAVLIIFVIFFDKELRSLLFSRSMASGAGMHAGFVFALLLMLTALSISVNIKLTGGLMFFSLIVNPAAAAYQLGTGYRMTVMLSSFFGLLSALLGFAVSYWLNVSTGACIVLASAAIFAFSAAMRRLRERMD